MRNTIRLALAAIAILMLSGCGGGGSAPVTGGGTGDYSCWMSTSFSGGGEFREGMAVTQKVILVPCEPGKLAVSLNVTGCASSLVVTQDNQVLVSGLGSATKPLGVSCDLASTSRVTVSVKMLKNSPMGNYGWYRLGVEGPIAASIGPS